MKYSIHKFIVILSYRYVKYEDYLTRRHRLRRHKQKLELYEMLIRQLGLLKRLSEDESKKYERKARSAVAKAVENSRQAIRHVDLAYEIQEKAFGRKIDAKIQLSKEAKKLVSESNKLLKNLSTTGNLLESAEKADVIDFEQQAARGEHTKIASKIRDIYLYYSFISLVLLMIISSIIKVYTTINPADEDFVRMSLTLIPLLALTVFVNNPNGKQSFLTISGVVTSSIAIAAAVKAMLTNEVQMIDTVFIIAAIAVLLLMLMETMVSASYSKFRERIE
jgi:hypothetical protein